MREIGQARPLKLTQRASCATPSSARSTPRVMWTATSRLRLSQLLPWSPPNLYRAARPRARGRAQSHICHREHRIEARVDRGPEREFRAVWFGQSGGLVSRSQRMTSRAYGEIWCTLWVASSRRSHVP